MLYDRRKLKIQWHRATTKTKTPLNHSGTPGNLKLFAETTGPRMKEIADRPHVETMNAEEMTAHGAKAMLQNHITAPVPMNPVSPRPIYPVRDTK